jgi:hypothetical protein
MITTFVQSRTRGTEFGPEHAPAKVASGKILQCNYDYPSALRNILQVLDTFAKCAAECLEETGPNVMKLGADTTNKLAWYTGEQFRGGYSEMLKVAFFYFWDYTGDFTVNVAYVSFAKPVFSGEISFPLMGTVSMLQNVIFFSDTEYASLVEEPE